MVKVNSYSIACDSADGVLISDGILRYFGECVNTVNT